MLRARTAPRRDGARRRRHRHDEQLRRASGSRRGPVRTRRRSRRRPASYHRRAPTAASTPPPASATSPRRSSGRSSAPCARAPTWRAARLLLSRQRIVRCRRVRRDELVRDGRAARQYQRHLATPVRQLEIVGLLDGRPGADLRRRLGDRQPDHPSRAQLGLARSPTVVGPARQVVVDDGAQRRGASRPWSSTSDCLPDDGHRSVVHRVVEGRAREHERVDDRDGDAHVSTVREPAQHRVAGSAVEVQVIADPSVHHRQHADAFGADETHMGDGAGIERRGNGSPVVPPALGLAPDLGT